MCLSLYAEPDAAPLPEHVVTYWLLVSNDSFSMLKHTRIDFPFDPAQQELLDFSASDSRAWISAVLTDSVTIQFEPLWGGDQIEVGLRFAIRPDVPRESVLQAQATASWPTTRPGFPIASNRVDLIVAADVAADELEPLAISRDASEPFSVSLSSDKFAPMELVSLWYHLPSGEIVELGEIAADEGGLITTTIDLGEETDGSYWLVAYGQCSDVTAAGPFSFVAESPPAPTAEPEEIAPPDPVDVPEEEEEEEEEPVDPSDETEAELE